MDLQKRSTFQVADKPDLHIVFDPKLPLPDDHQIRDSSEAVPHSRKVGYMALFSTVFVGIIVFMLI